MSEKELSYIVSTQPSFWVAGVNCYDMIVAVAKLVVGQLFDELNAEDELGELGEMEVYPNDVKECVDWLMREAELLPMITIKEIVDDYRERWTAASIGFTETKQGEQLPLPPDSVDQSNDGWVDGVSDLAKLIFYIADGSWAEGSAERSDGSPSVLSDEAIALTAYPTDDHGGAVINQ